MTPRLFVVAVSVVALAACAKKDPTATKRDAAGAKKVAAGASAGFDPTASAKALEGHWIIHDGNKQTWEFVVRGDHVKATDMRYSAPKTQEGTLLIRSETSFAVEASDGTLFLYSFAKVGDRLYMGMGPAIRMTASREFSVRIGPTEHLSRRGETCYLRRGQQGSPESTVQCGFQKNNGPGEVFFYEGDDKFNPGHKKRYELHVAGDHLLHEELMKSVARPK